MWQTSQIKKRLMVHRFRPHFYELDRIDAVELPDRGNGYSG